MIDGKPLSVCGICGCDPCDCDGKEVTMYIVRYRVDDVEHSIWVPESLVKQYFQVYKYVSVMKADGTIVEYSSSDFSGGGATKEKKK
jgi:hypothetical protein